MQINFIVNLCKSQCIKSGITGRGWKRYSFLCNFFRKYPEMDAIFILSGDFSAEKGKKGRGRDETTGVICIKVYNRKAFGGSGKLCGEQKELTVGRRGGKGGARKGGRKEGRSEGKGSRKTGQERRPEKSELQSGRKNFFCGPKNSGRRVAVRGKVVV